MSTEIVSVAANAVTEIENAVMIASKMLIIFYNGLVQARNKVKNSWSQIEVQLQRRFDLIPNLVETVKGYTEVVTIITSLETILSNF